MTTSGCNLPFAAALGDRLGDLSPAVRHQLTQPPGIRRYHGTMHQVWCGRGWRGWIARPFCWIGRRANTVFSSAGSNIPFELTTTVDVSSTGTRMTWVRTFDFPGQSQVFRGVITWEPRRGALIDRIGSRGRIEVELLPTVESGAMALHSGRQWWHVMGLRVRLPRWLVGSARIREWQAADSSLRMTLAVTHPLLGEVYGYDGTIQC